MSQHPSLRTKGKGTKFRSVLKRFERLLHLKKKEEWNDEASIFGMPKIKQVRFKIKKEKAAPEEAAAGAGAEATAEGVTGTTEAKAGKASKDVKDAKKDVKKDTSSKAAPKKEGK